MYAIILTILFFIGLLSFHFAIALYVINRELHTRLDIALTKGQEVCYDKAKYKNALKRAICLLKKD